MEKKEYYSLLGIEKDAYPKQIKEAYRSLAFENHPDRNKDNSEASVKMKAVNEAYAVLSNPKKRREYDAIRDRYGENAAGRFRQNYSEQDIFSGSDINQIFEEMARSFGLRGFDEIFKDFHQTGGRSFEFKGPGMYGKGFFFFGGFGRGGAFNMLDNIRRISGLVMDKMGIPQIPQKGRDIEDVITLSPTHSELGGPYAYFHKKQSKKLVVNVPAGVREGQKIRLSGIGRKGKSGGKPGDLYLKVRIKKSLIGKLKHLIKGTK